MHIVVVHNWQNEASGVAKTIAETLGILIFEARQKIAGGTPVALVSLADPLQASRISEELFRHGVPAFVIDSQELRSRNQSHAVARFVLGEQQLQIETSSGESLALDYTAVESLLLASCSAGELQTSHSIAERKFSLGKTLLAGGVPMTKKVKTEVKMTSEERDQTLWLYTRDGKLWIFGRGAMNYTGLGSALQLSCDLNFTYLKNELRRRAPQAAFDDRLLRRGELIRVLGQPLRAETDLDLAFEILARSLREQQAGGKIPPQ